MPNLFARAASLSLGDSHEDAGDPDGRLLLALRGYAESSAEAHHRAGGVIYTGGVALI